DNHCASWKLIGMHRQGVFAERLALPEKCLVPLPDGIDRERAVLVEPLACCVGAHVTAVDPLAERRAIAERLGAADTAAELDPGEFDLVVDAAGFEPTW